MRGRERTGEDHGGTPSSGVALVVSKGKGRASATVWRRARQRRRDCQRGSEQRNRHLRSCFGNSLPVTAVTAVRPVINLTGRGPGRPSALGLARPLAAQNTVMHMLLPAYTQLRTTAAATTDASSNVGVELGRFIVLTGGDGLNGRAQVAYSRASGAHHPGGSGREHESRERHNWTIRLRTVCHMENAAKSQMHIRKYGYTGVKL